MAESKTELARAYARGYHAGKRRAATINQLEKTRREELAFWERVFLAVAPYFAGCDPWSRGGWSIGYDDEWKRDIGYGVPATASRVEIDAAYRRLRGQQHPDRGGDPEKFHAIQRAYEESAHV